MDVAATTVWDVLQNAMRSGALNEDPEICSPWQQEVQGGVINLAGADFMQNGEAGIGKLHSYAAYVIRICVCLLYVVAANSDEA
ncbi:hypothetical protein VNO80_07617 [Phaseolus coccineus]|uniref:Uncharacterized protein n=1 Tax=Phaseolus coccineus TaxID=3886 RepID=A0AAN9NJE7_PHACN